MVYVTLQKSTYVITNDSKSMFNRSFYTGKIDDLCYMMFAHECGDQGFTSRLIVSFDLFMKLVEATLRLVGEPTLNQPDVRSLTDSVPLPPCAGSRAPSGSRYGH